MELATTREVSRPTAVTERWDRRVLRAISWVRWKFDGPPLSRLRRQLPLKGEPSGRRVPQWARCKREGAVMRRDGGIPPYGVSGSAAQPCRGGYHPPARPIAACGRLECHSEGAKRPWNLADYGAPIKCQRPNSPVTLSEVEGSCRLRDGIVDFQRWRYT